MVGFEIGAGGEITLDCNTMESEVKLIGDWEVVKRKNKTKMSRTKSEKRKGYFLSFNILETDTAIAVLCKF